MKKFYARLLAFFAFLFLSSIGFAQTADQYTFTTGTGATLDPMTGAATAVGANNDDTPSGLFPIGFTFAYEGLDYTQFSVSPDGFIRLGNTAASGQFTNAINSTTNIPKLFPFWDDLATGTGGYVRYIVTGTAPNRILKIEWFVTVPRNTVGAANTKFQAWLYETTNVIEFRYDGTPAGTTSGASIGIRGAQNSTTAGVFKYHSVSSATHTSSTTATNDVNTVYPGVGRFYMFTPPPPPAIDLGLNSISGLTSGCPNPSAPISVVIKNSGLNTLDFATTPATIAVNITGASTQTLNATVNTGTLAPGATLTVPVTPNANLSAGGTHNFNATVTIAGDGNSGNNSSTTSTVIAVTAVSPWAETFPTTTTPTGWNTTGWSIAANHGLTTNGLFRNIWTAAPTGEFNTLAVGPVTAGDILTFDYRIVNFSGYPTGGNPTGDWGNFKIQVSTNCGATYTDLATINNTNHVMGGTAWTNKQYSLAAFAGQRVVVRVVATWVSGDYYIDFDNFNIAATPPVDLSAISLSGLTACPNNSLPLSVVIRNTGLNTLDFTATPATVTVNVTGASTQTMTATVNTGTLAPNTNLTVLVAPNANFSVAGTHNINATVAITGDGNPNNNGHLATNVIGATTTAPWSEAFNATTTPTGWNTTGWTIGATHGRTTNGLYRNIWTAAPTGEFNTLNVGPITAGDVLSFDYRILNFSGYPTGGNPTGNWGSFKVQISTNCGVTYTDLATINSTNHVMNGQNWTTKEYSLTPYAGQLVRVRIQAQWVSGDYFIDFDNFNIRPSCNGAPTAGSVTAGQNPVCLGNATTVKVTGQTNAAGITYQWQSSPDNVNWTDITGATDTVATVTPTAATYYRVLVICTGVTPNVNTPTAGVLVNIINPQVLTNTPGSRCGPGSVALSATGTAGATFNWYNAPTGGQIVGTGALFSTPVISQTTTYYVTATQGPGTSVVGASPTGTTCGTITGSTATDWPLRFNTTAPVKINSAFVIPQAAGTFTVALRQALSTTNIQTASFTFTAAQVGIPQQITLGWNITNPGSYQLTNTTGGVGRITTFTCPYPFTSVGGGFSIVGSATTSGSANNTNTYNSFFNISVTEGCESARTAVVATVNAGPSFDVTDSTTICNGAIKALTVNTPAANFTQYTWTPSAGLFTDAAATIPYTGGSATTVYVRNTTAATYTYIANAVNGTTSCTGIDSVKVTVLPAGVVVNATPTQICVSGQTSLSITPATGYTGAQLQWQSSTDGVNYTNIAGATTTTYTTPTITQTTTYRLVIRDKDGNICQQPTRTIQVNSPSVVSSQGAVNCGSGVLTLTATGSAGTTLNWYTSANGGSPVGSGGSYTTPNLSTTTTYYVSATSGGAIQGLGPISPSATGVTGAATGTSTAQGILFDVLNVANGVNIQSVDIFPTAAVGTPFTIVVRQGPGTTGTILRTYSGVTTVSGTVGAPVAQTVPVNFQLPAGFDYVMLYSTAVASVRNTGATVYPQSIPGEISLTNGVPSGTWNYFYNWRVGNGCESPRVAVTATISTNTAINTQPVGQTICAGAPLTLSVNAVGATLTYQWFKGTQAITGATQSTYTIAAAQVSDAGTYSVRVTGACGTVTSQVVTINVNATNSWLGTTSNDWHNPANWCGSVPTATSDIVIPSGTPFQPVITALAEARNLTINTGASVTVQQNGFLSIFGNLQNNGTFSAANGFVGFKGAQPQTTTAITAGTIVMNGAGGLTLQGAMSAQTLILENGNITLGTHNLTVGSSANGSVQSHVITNGTGSVISQNVSAANTIVPVGANGDAYNPVIITNGQNRDYTVRVAIGLNPGVTNSARAINRTWTIQPSAAVTQPVELTLQWADTHGNGSVTPGSDMEVGLNSGGAQWNILTPPGGLTPVGGPAARRVTVLAQSFGNFIVSSPGGFSYPLAAPSIDPDVRGAQLLPNITQGQTTLRVSVERPTQITWVLVDGGGRVVERFSQNYTQGVHDRTIRVHSLANGQYYLMGYTKKGRTSVLKLVKQ